MVWLYFYLTAEESLRICFPGGSVVKNLPVSVGDAGSIPGSGRFPGGGSDNPLQYSCLENPSDRGTWWAPVYGVSKESNMTEQLNNNNLKHTVTLSTGLPCGSAGKESTCNEGDLGSIPGLGRFPKKGKITHSSIPAWRIPWTTVLGVTKSQTQLSFHFHFTLSINGELKK